MLTFPTLSGSIFGPVHLNLLAHEHSLLQEQDRFHALTKHGASTNPFLDPHKCHQIILDEHARLGIHHSYGGYLENRRHVWRDSYLERHQHWIHLGTDFTVPAETPVAATWNGIVAHCDDDSPEVGGWGPRVIVRLANDPNIVLIYAHLGNVSCKPGDMLVPGDIFATVGDPPHNGVWFPHLHVQVVDMNHYQKDWDSLVHELDGYTNLFSATGAAKIFPDPMRYVRLWN